MEPFFAAKHICKHITQFTQMTFFVDPMNQGTSVSIEALV